MADEATAVVIDTGTGETRAGTAGEETPQCVLPTAAGLVTYDASGGRGELLWGEDLEGRLRWPAGKQFGGALHEWVRNKRAVVADDPNSCGDDSSHRLQEGGELRRFLRRGGVELWEELEGLWLYAVKKALKLAPEEHPVLLTEPPMNPKLNRELMTRAMFEDLGIPAMYIAITSVLALYGSGRTSGLIVEAGEGSTFAVPIVEGYVIQHACCKGDVVGQDLTAYVMDLLEAKHRGVAAARAERYWRSVSADWQRPLVSSLAEGQLWSTAQFVKENVCQLATSLTTAGATDGRVLQQQESGVTAVGDEKSVELPDGQMISLGAERYDVWESFFNPALVGRDPLSSSGIQFHALSAINKCDPDTRRELFANLVVAGGCAALEGFGERLALELMSLAPSSSLKVKLSPVHPAACQTRGKAVWLGGSILASLSTFQQQWVTKDEYDESGPAIAHRKCF